LLIKDQLAEWRNRWNNGDSKFVTEMFEEFEKNLSHLEAQVNLKETFKKEAEHWKKEEKYYRKRFNDRYEVAEQVNALADFLLKEYPDEIGKGDPVHGESAMEVAIRLLTKREELRK
jgi:hypothetical protein